MFKVERVAIITLLLPVLICSFVSAQQSELAQPVEQLADQLAFANEGEVKAVSGESIYIDLGQQQGVREGMTFEVVRLGEPITSDGEIIGYQEEILGEAEVVRARKKISILEMVKPATEGKNVKQGDKVYQKKKKVKRIAITEFPFGEQFNQLTKNIEDRLYTAMIQRGMDVVERDRLNEVIKEQKTEWSGLFDLSSAAELGKLLGVEAVLIGSVSDQGEQLSIRARLVDVDTAQAIAAAASSVKQTPNITEALQQGVRGRPTGTTTSTQETGGQEIGGTEESGGTGGVLFSDDFEDEMSPKWRTRPLGGARLGVEKGALTILGEKSENMTIDAFVGENSWRDYIVTADIVYEEPDPNAYYGGGAPVRVYVRAHGQNNFVALIIAPERQTGLYVKQNGMWMETSEDANVKEIPIREHYHVTITAIGGQIHADINGQFVGKIKETSLKQGFVGIQCSLSSDTRDAIYFDNFRVESVI